MSKKTGLFIASGLFGYCLFWFLESYLFLIIHSDAAQFPFNLVSGFAEKVESLGLEGTQSVLGQLKFRWLILVGLAYYLSMDNKNQSESKMTSSQALWVIRILVVIQLLYLPDLARELQIRSQWAGLYEPLPIWKWALPSYLPGFFHQWAILLLFGTGAFAILKKWPAESPNWILVVGFTLLIWTILLVQFFGFGKIDHTYSSLYSGLWGLFIWLLIRRTGFSDPVHGFRLFQAFIWCCYFFSGSEKILFAGFDWISSHHFTLLNELHPTQTGNWISTQPILPALLLFGAVSFQLAAPLQWRFPKWGYVNAAGALVFHLGTWFIFGIGGWQSPWILMAIFLLPVWQTGFSFFKKQNI